MMKLPTIYLLRHGETEWNVEGRYQGQLDSPLTKKGERQAEMNALKLKRYLNMKKTKLFSSPLGRAKSTSLIIANMLNIDVSKIIFEEQIQEFNYGVFEGKTKAFCKKEFADEFEARERNKWSYILEGGESYEMVTKRLNLWLESVQHEEVIVVVAHEMINRALRGIYLNLEREEILTLFQPNDILIKLENGYERVLV